MARKAKVPGWEHYFPFPRGRSFEVVLERPRLPVRGRGTVVKRTAAALRLKLEVQGGFLIPRMSADVELTYSGEGGGNRGRIEVQVGARRESFEDDDVTIESQPAKGCREIASSLKQAGRGARAVLCAGEGQCHVSARGFEIRLVAQAAPRGR